MKYFSNIVVSIMIKNESAVIEKTLVSYISHGFFKFMVMDTGSTDSTLKVLYELQKCPDIILSIVQDKFIDFSTSRNQLLKYTYDRFSDCCSYTLMIDAEWYLQMNDPHPLVATIASSTADVIYVRIQGMNYAFLQPRLFRMNGNAFFRGRIHETVYDDDPSIHIMKIPVKGFYLEWNPSIKGVHQSLQRMNRDIEILLEDNKRFDGCDGRTLFYLGFTYECKHHYNEAMKYYKQRIQLSDIDSEEYFLAYYYAGRLLLTRLMEIEKGAEFLHKAVSLRPNRVEPLVWIGRYKKDLQEKYNYFRAACSIHRPKRALLLEINIWSIERWKQLALYAPKVDRIEEGRTAFEHISGRLSEKERQQLTTIYGFLKKK